MAQHGEMRINLLKAELKIDTTKTVKESEYWVLTWLRAS